MPQTVPAIGEDVTALMPSVGEDVSALMGSVPESGTNVPDPSILKQMFSRENIVGGLTENAQILGSVLMPWGRVAQTGGRIISTGVGAVKGGASRLPIIGPVAKGAIRGAQKAWQASAPRVSAAARPAQPAAAAGVKQRLTAPQTAQYLRKEYGSEQAGRMLYGKSGVGLPPAERTAAIKRLAPGTSQLPQQAQRAITQGVRQGTPQDAWQYIQKAPNDLAREYLIRLMRGTP